MVRKNLTVVVEDVGVELGTLIEYGDEILFVSGFEFRKTLEVLLWQMRRYRNASLDLEGCN